MSTNQVNVLVEYNPKIFLDGNHVEDRGEVFDCGNCTGSADCVCCNNLNNNRANGCRKCSCQNKITSGSNTCGNCIVTGGGCYYRGCGACGGCGSCSTASYTLCNGQNVSDSGDCTVNNTIFDCSSVASVFATCQQAMGYIANPNIIGPVTNANAIQTQCAATSQLLCCQGNTDLGSALCGPFWGPTNNAGNCDTIMQNFCQTNPTNALCACLESNIPVPECTDKRCHGTNAMKLSNMLNNPCQGNYLTCQQFLTLSPNAQSNVIQYNTMSQTCNQNNAAASSSQAVSSSLMWILIASGVTIALLLIGGIIVFAVQSNNNKKKLAAQRQQQYRGPPRTNVPPGYFPPRNPATPQRPIPQGNIPRNPQYVSPTNPQYVSPTSPQRPIPPQYNRPPQYSPRRVQ